jgi:hypothetical protein
VSEFAGLDDGGRRLLASAGCTPPWIGWRPLPFPTLPYPTLIDGVCPGGGLGLAPACRYRIASADSDTRLGCPEVRRPGHVLHCLRDSAARLLLRESWGQLAGVLVVPDLAEALRRLGRVLVSWAPAGAGNEWAVRR